MSALAQMVKQSILGSEEKKIVIIGANSFLANALVKAINRPEKIIGIYHNNTHLLNRQVMQVSVNDLATIKASDIAVVYILSAYIPDSDYRSDSDMLFKTNVKLTKTICEQFYQSKIVFCSSVSVYEQSQLPINEFSSLSNKSEYGISKLWGEAVVKYCSKYSIVRISSMYGGGMKHKSIIPYMIRDAKEKKQINVWGDGQRFQNYIHVSDVANYLIKAAANNQNDTFLATSLTSVCNKDLAELISQYTGARIIYTGTDDSPSFFYDNSYTNSILAYQPKINLETGLKELIQCQ